MGKKYEFPDRIDLSKAQVNPWLIPQTLRLAIYMEKKYEFPDRIDLSKAQVNPWLIPQTLRLAISMV